MGSTITDAVRGSGYIPWNGPVIDGNDNLYVIAEDANTADDLAVFKSTDDGSTWSRIDTANQPNLTNGLQSFSMFQDGTTLHIAACSAVYSAGMGFAQDNEYYTFHTSDAGGTADTWQISESIVTTDNSYQGQVDVVVRSDGDVIVAHMGNLNSVMGSDYPVVAYSRREGGSWTTNIAVSSNVGNTFSNPAICLGTSDSTHFTYRRGTGIEVRTLDSANNLSTAVVDTGFWSPISMRRPISWDNSGTQQIMVVEDDERLKRMEEDGSGDIAIEAGQDEVSPGFSIAELAFGVTRTADGEVRAYGGNFGDATGGPDLYTSQSTEGDDADWGSVVEIEDGVDVSNASDGGGSVSVNTFTRGAEVTGIVWLDATVGNFIYSEVVAQTEFLAEQATESDTATEAEFGPDTGTAADLLGSLTGPTRDAGMYRNGVNIYVVQTETETAGTRSVPQILKSIDGGSNWGYFDSHANNPNTTQDCSHISTVFDGTYIGVIWYSGDNEYAYSVYDISQDLWVIEQELVASDASSSTNQGGTAIGVRPTSGEVVVAYVSTTNYTVSAKIRPDIAGGSGFGSEITVHNTASVMHAPTLVVDADNDDVHVCWVGAATNDNLYHRRIDGSTDALGTLQTSSVAACNSNQLPGSLLIYHGWLYHMWVDETPHLHVRYAQIADVPTWNDITVTDAAIATVNAGDWIPASLHHADYQLVLTWIRDSDNTIMWAVGPKFGANHATATTITDTYGWLGGVLEKQSTRVHLLGVESDVSTGDTAATFRDLDVKLAAGDTDMSTYSTLEPQADLSLISRNAKTFCEWIIEIPESSSEPHRFYQIRHRKVAEFDYDFDIYVTLDYFHWFTLEDPSDAAPTSGSTAISSYSTSYDGSLIHLTQGGGSTNNTTTDGQVGYWQWDPASEKWNVENEEVSIDIRWGAVTKGTAVHGRSDGTVVCAYCVEQSGGGTSDLNYRIRSSGGTWGSANTIASGTDYYIEPSGLIGTSERLHWFYYNQQQDTHHHRSLSSGDSLDTANQVASNSHSSSYSATGALLDGTTIGVLYMSGNRLRGFKTATSGANPTWSSQQSVDDSAFTLMNFGSFQSVTTLYLRDGTFHTLMPRGSDGNPLDLWTDSRDGGTWGTDEDTGLNTVADVYQMVGSVTYSLGTDQDYMFVQVEDPGFSHRILHVQIAPPPTINVDVGFESNVALEAFLGPLSQANATLWGEARFHNGASSPWHEINGDLWVVQPETESGPISAPRRVPTVLRSTNDGSSWTAYRHTHNPNYGTTADHSSSVIYATVSDGQYIAVAWLAGYPDVINNSEGRYSVFDTQTLTWVIENELIGSTFRNASSGGLAIRPGSGEVVFSFESAPTGSSSNRIDVQIRPDIAGGSGFGSRIVLHGPHGTSLYGSDLAINPANDDVHVAWASSSNLYHRVVRGTDDSLSTLQTIAQSNIESDITIMVGYHGWLYHMWVDTSAIVHIRRAKMEETPTWTTCFSSTAATNQTILYSWYTLTIGDGQLIASWVRDSDKAIMWTQGPFFNFENDSGTAITDDTWMGRLLVSRSGRLRLMGTENDDAETDLAATFHNLDIRFAASTDGLLVWDEGASGFPDDRAPFFHTGTTWRNTFELEETSSVPRIFHAGYVQSLAAVFEFFWYISLDGVVWFHSPAPRTNITNSQNSGAHQADVVYDGTIVHIGAQSLHSVSTEEFGEVVYYQYDPVDEQWDVEEEAVANTYDTASAKLAPRSDGTVVIAYLDASSGSTLSNLRYQIRSSGGTWGGEQTVQAGSSGQGILRVEVVLGASDRVHFIFGDGGNTNLYHRSLSSGDVLDTANTIDTSSYTVEGVHYDGTLVGVVYGNSTRGRGFRSATSGAAPTWSSEQDVDDQSWSDLDGLSDANKCFFLVEDPTGTQSGQWFAVSMPRGTAPHDIYLDQRVTDWQTDWDSTVDSMADSTTGHDPTGFFGNYAYVENGVAYLLVHSTGGTNDPSPTNSSRRIQRVPIDVTPSSVLEAELASESDIAYEVTLGETTLNAEQATESDVAYEVVLEVDETTFDAELASESDTAQEVVLEVDEPPLDASTNIAFSIYLVTGSADQATPVPPDPITGKGTVKRGDHRTKIYRPSHNVIRKR